MPSKLQDFKKLHSQRTRHRLLASLAAALLLLLEISPASAENAASDVALKVVQDNDNLIVMLVNESIGTVTVNGRFALGSILHEGGDLELQITDEDGKERRAVGRFSIRSVPKEYASALDPGQVIGRSLRICDIERYYGLNNGMYKIVVRLQIDPEFYYLRPMSMPTVVESEIMDLEVSEQRAPCLLIPSD